MNELIQCIGRLRLLAANGDVENVDQAEQIISHYLARFPSAQHRISAITEMSRKLEPDAGELKGKPDVEAFYVTLSEYLDQTRRAIQNNPDWEATS